MAKEKEEDNNLYGEEAAKDPKKKQAREKEKERLLKALAVGKQRRANENRIIPFEEFFNDNVNESLGGRLRELFNELKETLGVLEDANYINENGQTSLLKQVEQLEQTFKKSLKGKGLIGW